MIRTKHPVRPTLAGLVAALVGCGVVPDSPLEASRSVAHEPRQELVTDLGRLVPSRRVSSADEASSVRLERVSAAVPWPRGLEWVDGELVVLARGRHRRAGGVDHSIPDDSGSLFRVDPAVAEPVVPGRVAGAEVAANAEVLASSADSPFHNLPDRALDPADDALMDRPYCTLIYDAPSRNLFICGYSGVDLPGKRFRKNATDSIHRFDLRTAKWHPVEMHDASVVPQDELGYVVSNEYYPHHDPAANAAPHGWLNGPDGGCVAGDYLYCVSKDNHLVVQYELEGVRREPGAEYPHSRPVLGPNVTLRHPGGTSEVELLGPSCAARQGDHLYLGYRTSSAVVRLALEPDGQIVQPAVAELIAVFEPWDAEAGRSANLIDLAFNSAGELFASCAEEGRIWKIGRPDPARPFYGDDRSERATSAAPYADLALLTGNPKARCGNILFDDQDRLYVCSGNYDTASSRIAGVIYRVVGS